MNKYIERILNAGKSKEKQILTGQCEGTFLKAEASDGDSLPKVNGVLYNGGALDVGWGYPVVVQLSGIEIPDKVRLDVDHSPKVADKIGSITASISDNKLMFTGTMSGKSPAVDNILALNEAGETWETSMDLRTQDDRFVDVNEQETVNGQEFTGPFILVTQSRLVAASVVTLGADGESTLEIAAQAAGGENMEFAKWVKAQGFDPENLSDKQKETLQAAFDVSQMPELPDDKKPEKTVAASDSAEDVEKSIRAKATAELDRIDGIKTVCASYESDVDAEKLTVLRAQAINGEISKDKLEVDLMKASRPAQGANIQARSSNDAPGEKVIEAALSKTMGIRDVEKQYDEKVLDASDKMGSGYSIQAMLMDLAHRNGFQERRFHAGNIEPVLKAAFSTQAATDILNNVANKTLRDAFMFVEGEWEKVVNIRSASNFKPTEHHRLTGDFEYKQIGADGEIKHGTFSEDKYTTQADTYAIMVGLTRKNLIDDDLSAFNDTLRMLGRGGALKINKVVWALMNSLTFDAGLQTNALDFDGLETAKQAFEDQTDDNGDPLGVRPRILLVGNALEATARNLMNTTATIVVAGDSDVAQPNRSYLQGMFDVVSSLYIEQRDSEDAWYLLADPNDLPVIDVSFLNGKRMPTVESTSADFNTLGIKMRAYHDFGADAAEDKGGIVNKIA